MSNTFLQSKEPIVATAVGFGTFELIKLWRDAAPSLKEVRAAAPADVGMRQRLMDANYMSVGVIMVIGGSFAAATKSWGVLILPLLSVAMLSYWYHCVLNSSNEMM